MQQHTTVIQPPTLVGSTEISWTDRSTIAVIPFANQSGSPDQEYFSDGLTEDIITDLSRISGLHVIVRQSSFAYKGEDTGLQKIGRELRARYILQGSVRRSNDRVRVNASLIDRQGQITEPALPVFVPWHRGPVLFLKQAF